MEERELKNREEVKSVDPRTIAFALENVTCLLSGMKAGKIPCDQEDKKALQSFSEKLCRALVDNLAD